MASILHIRYDTTKNDANFPGIPEGESQTIMFTPLSGLLSQQKYVPLRTAALTFELELISNYTDPFVLNTMTTGVFTQQNTSNQWAISNVQARCDIIMLDNELENSYSQLLMSGKTLPINYSTYITQFQSILGGTGVGGAGVGQQKVRLNVARSLSRLKSVFISFDKPDTTPQSLVYKTFNSFYSPMFRDTVFP